jgi:hypothetical protein
VWLLARRDVVREYESVCDAAGVYAGLVDIATLSVLNLFLVVGQRPPATGFSCTCGPSTPRWRSCAART